VSVILKSGRAGFKPKILKKKMKKVDRSCQAEEEEAKGVRLRGPRLTNPGLKGEISSSWNTPRGVHVIRFQKWLSPNDRKHLCEKRRWKRGLINLTTPTYFGEFPSNNMKRPDSQTMEGTGSSSRSLVTPSKRKPSPGINRKALQLSVKILVGKLVGGSGRPLCRGGLGIWPTLIVSTGTKKQKETADWSIIRRKEVRRGGGGKSKISPLHKSA